MNKHLTQADIEIEKSRQEMTCMKEAHYRGCQGKSGSFLHDPRLQR